MTIFRKLAGAVIGERIAGRYGRGPSGALIGAGVAAVARRGFGPLGAVLAVGWVAKKLIERKRASDAPIYPADVSPVAPVGGTTTASPS